MRTEVFSTEVHRLRIKLPAGRVQLETAETAETVVDLDGPHEDEATIELRGNEVVVDVERKGFFGRGRDHRLSIRAPHGVTVGVTTASADVEGRGRYGDVSVKSASGDVELDEAGSLDVKTASGDIVVRRVVGAASAKTASGDVRITEARAGVSVHTASGDVAVESVEQGKVTLRSASGDIEVGIRSGSKLWVDATSMSGDMASELDLSDTPPGGDSPLVELRATSMSGDVTLRRA